MSKYKVTIVFVNWKTPRLLATALGSVFADPNSEYFEIFVVDNNSGDESVEMLRRDFPIVKIVANSENVRRRISKTYRRESVVIPPPVAVKTFYWKPAEDYFLVVAELVPYKRIDTAVRAFSRSGRRLRVAGSDSHAHRTVRAAAASTDPERSNQKR